MAAAVAGVLAAAVVLVLNTGGKSQVTASQDLRLATADAACGFTHCANDGVTPSPTADAYPAQQLAWLQSYQFAVAVSRMPGSPHLSPNEIWRSVTVLPLGAASRKIHACWWASHCAQISFQASSYAAASAMVERYSEMYLLWSSRIDARHLIALAGSIPKGSLDEWRDAVERAQTTGRTFRAGPQREGVTGASTLPSTLTPPVTSRRTFQHTAGLAVAAGVAVAMILLGAFGLADARRQRRLKPSGHAEPPAQHAGWV
jgi:hypothetical protein